jgi:hypothetical protein
MSKAMHLFFLSYKSAFKIRTALNCDKCISNNAVKLFKIDDITINNKQIYISYNLLLKIIHKDGLEDPIRRFCYIEFNNIILIELDIVAYNYYLHKLPIYNYIGELILPNMYNNNYDIINQFTLNIHPIFIKMFGITEYLNPNKIIKSLLTINDAINQINDAAMIILIYHFATTKIYNLPKEFIDLIKSKEQFDIKEINIIINKSTHNLDLKNNLYNVYFDIYNCSLKLNKDGYDGVIPRISYQNIYLNIDTEYYDIKLDYCEDDDFKRLSKIFTIQVSTSGGFYKKYIKYKQKYLALKSVS